MHSLPDDLCALIRENDPFSDDWREGSFVEQVAEFDRRIRFLMIDISFGNVPDMSKWEPARERGSP